MRVKKLNSWMKHADFIVLDIICLQISFVLSYWLVHGIRNPYLIPAYRYQAAVLFVCQLVVVFFTPSYQGILRRKKYEEGLAVCKYMAEILVLSLVYMFLTHETDVSSRLQIGFTTLLFIILDFLLRYANKKRIIVTNADLKNRKSLVLVTSSKLMDDALEKLTKADYYIDYWISRVILLDKDFPEDLKTGDIPVSLLNKETVREICHNWVDEVFILQPDDMPFPKKLMDDLMSMGITVSYTMSALIDDKWPVGDIGKLGSYRVLTNSIHFISAGEQAIKRLTDILGGLVGCLLTGILFLFVAPAIYIKSPGPIFFKQERVGQNGKTFQMYKFRSMYMDAEERKAALMAQNRIQDGMMFKMDDDPRIIGSEKKDKHGRPRGIGNFIRNTSIDEFPQFYNILRGDMSLVGTRPPTMDEWIKYELEYRVRMSTKPGLTGMWQVSGRSKITDFGEVVRLDRQYIENWSLLLDLKILLKTVVVVLTRHGAE